MSSLGLLNLRLREGMEARDRSGQSLGYDLEVSYNSGTTWFPYTGAFHHLVDECGVRLSSTQLDPVMWDAIKKDSLAFRVTATVRSDEPLTVSLQDGPLEGLRPVRTAIIERGRDYQYREVTALSRFYGDPELGTADEVDDSGLLRQSVREMLGRLQSNRWSGSVELAMLRPDIRPGDRVAGIEGRDKRLFQASEQRGLPVVREVVLGFEDGQSTRVVFGGSEG